MAGVVGISLTLFFKKELRILEAPHKVVAVSFLLSTIVGFSVFTYLNFSSTQENYAWMHDGLHYQRMGQSFLINHEFIVDGSFSNLFVASQTSDYFTAVIMHSLGKDFGSVFLQFWFFMVLTMLFMLSYTWIFSPYVKSSFSRIRDERVSCLWLSIMLPLFIVWLIEAIYFVFENEWMHNLWISYYPVSQIRYLIFTLIMYCFIIIVPLSWVAYESTKREQQLASK